MSYQIIQAESYWDCLDSLRRDDAYKAHLVDALAELRRQPFHNPRLATHDIGSARNGRKLFSSDVGGRASNRRIVWQVFGRTIVVLLYGPHKVQDRARRMEVAYDDRRQLMEVYEQAPESDVKRPYREQRRLVGRLFMGWTDRELTEKGFPAPVVEHLRRLNNDDELVELAGHLERAVNLIAPDEPATGGETGGGGEAAPAATGAARPETDLAGGTERSPPGAALTADEPENAEAAPAADDGPGAAAPDVTEEDLALERLLADEQAGASFTRVEPEYLAEVIGRPIEDWMIFLHPDQRRSAARRYQGPARVRGAAGTGKTVVGLHRAAHLAGRNRELAAERDRQLIPDADPPLPVLFTTYINSLPPVFEELYRRIPGTRIGEVEFTNVDKLARRVCAEAGDRAFVNATKAKKAFDEAFKRVVVPGTPLHGRFTSQYLRDEIAKMIKGRAVVSLEDYLELARTGRRAQLGRLQRTQVWELMERWNAEMARHGTIDFSDVIVRALGHARRLQRPTYSAVIVDEAQDLTLAGLLLLRALVNAPTQERDRPDGLFILGDGAQRVYPGGFTLLQAGVEVRGRTTVLSENYRNTGEIIKAAMAVAGDRHIEDLDEEFRRGSETVSTSRRGPRPLLVRAEGLDAQASEIARQIEDLVRGGEDFGLGDVAVLAPFNATANGIRSRLANLGLDVQSLDNYDGRPNDLVKVGTYHRGKGLEFKAVFLPQLGRFPPPASKGATDEQAAEDRDLAVSLLYVAMTRARDVLVALHGASLTAEVAAAVDSFERR